MSTAGDPDGGPADGAYPKGLRAIVRQFVGYAVAGGVATAVDWGSFYGFNTVLGFDYRLSVALSFTLGAITNYSINKTVIFKDHTRTIGTQIAIYIAVSLVSLACSVALMYIQVENIGLPPLIARVMTTGVMLVVNFIMHKFITFNQKVYQRLYGNEKGAPKELPR
jgi:putative flippase GtrA